jgi:hypothetical protein
MKIVQRDAVLATVFLLAASSSAVAADMALKARPLPPVVECSNDIVRSNNQISVDIVGTKWDYLERDQLGIPIDSEKGWVPGVQLTGSVMGCWLGFQNVYAMARYTYLNGHTDYWAGGGPVTRNVDGAVVSTGDFRLGKGFDVGTNWMLTPYVGAGLQQWDRDLSNAHGPFGYHEAYKHDYVGAGLLVQVSPISRLVLSANGLVGSTFDAKMVATQNGGFPIPPWTFGLGSSVIYMAGLAADYALTANLHVNIGVDYVDYKYGRSAFNPFGFFEPDSRTQNWTVKGGLGWSWGAAAPVVAKY